MKQGYLIGGIAFGMLLTIGLGILADRWGLAPLTVFVAGLLSGMIVIDSAASCRLAHSKAHGRWKGWGLRISHARRSRPV